MSDIATVPRRKFKSAIDPRLVGEVLPIDAEHEIFKATLFVCEERISLGSFPSRREAALAILDVVMPDVLRADDTNLKQRR